MIDTDADGVAEPVGDTVSVCDTDAETEALFEIVAVSDIVEVIEMLDVTVIPEVEDHEPVRDRVLVSVADTDAVSVGVDVTVVETDVVAVTVPDTVTDPVLVVVPDADPLGLTLGLAMQYSVEPAGISTDTLLAITT